MQAQRIAKLLQMYEENPADTFLNHALGMEYLAIQDFEVAVKFFNKCVELDPSHTASRYQLARHYIDTGREEVARPLIEEAILLLSKSGNQKTLNEFRSLLDEIMY